MVLMAQVTAFTCVRVKAEYRDLRFTHAKAAGQVGVLGAEGLLMVSAVKRIRHVTKWQVGCRQRVTD